MYTRLHIPCRNTACLIYLFIVLVLCYVLWFLWMAQWDMVPHSCSVLPMDSLTRVRVRSSLGLESALCSDCLPSSTDLSQGIVCALV